ncbi:MAG TPA: hypothetical protein VGC42_22955, partial [Kofleriaceae bacterium]
MSWPSAASAWPSRARAARYSPDAVSSSRWLAIAAPNRCSTRPSSSAAAAVAARAPPSAAAARA